jgi:hypothetical protein
MSSPLSLKAEDVIGAWTLVAWTITWPDGHLSQPYQPHPTGLIMYEAGGAMSVAMCAGDRPRFSSSDVRKQPDAAKAAAFDSYFHYAGTWELRGDTIVHRITMALNPNMIGTEQVRAAELRDDLLILRAEEALSGHGVRQHRITWRAQGRSQGR